MRKKAERARRGNLKTYSEIVAFITILKTKIDGKGHLFFLNRGIQPVSSILNSNEDPGQKTQLQREQTLYHSVVGVI